MDAKTFYMSTPQARQKAKMAIENAPDDFVVRVSQRTRSLAANARMWAMLGDISKQVIWTVNGHAEKLAAEDWKAIVTASLAQEQRMAPGVRGGFVMLGTSTSGMTLREMSEMIEMLYAFGAEHDVVWSERVDVPGWQRSA